MADYLTDEEQAERLKRSKASFSPDGMLLKIKPAGRSNKRYKVQALNENGTVLMSSGIMATKNAAQRFIDGMVALGAKRAE